MSIYPAAGITLSIDTLTGLTAYKESSQSVTSSTTLVDDTALALTLTGSGLYRFSAWLYISGESAYVAFTFSGTAQWSTPGGAVQTASGDKITAAVDGWLINGTITAASGGDTLQLQWAQSSSSATATVMNPGSYLTATRLA